MAESGPVLGKYVGSEPEKMINMGVFNARNLGLYTYGFSNPVKISDPDGNYGVVGHHDTMYAAAWAAGFSPNQAASLAAAAWQPDVDARNAMSGIALLNPLGWVGVQGNIHQLHGGSPGEVQPRMDTLAAQVVSKFSQTGEISWGGQNILHGMGDSRAHVDANTGAYYNYPLGHLLDSLGIGGRDPDNIYNNQAGFLDYTGSLFDILAGASGSRPNMNREDFMGKMTEISGKKLPEMQHILMKVNFPGLPEAKPGHGLLGAGE